MTLKTVFKGTLTSNTNLKAQEAFTNNPIGL